MAVYSKPVEIDRKGPWDLKAEGLPPEGTFYATCLDIVDRFGVERPNFEDPTKLEKRDLTWFLFGFRDAAGKPHRVATYEMRISGHEKATLFKFLKGWLGKPFVFGQDYAAPEAQGGMKGRKALLTLAHVARKSGDGAYAEIVSVSPMPAVASAPAVAAPIAPPAAQAPTPAPLPAVPEAAPATSGTPAAPDPAGDGFRGDEIPF